MSTALARYFQTTMSGEDEVFGHPMVGYDDLGADPEILQEAMGLEELGFTPGAAMRLARQRMMARRRARMSNRCAHQPFGRGRGDELGFDDDDDDDDLEGDEQEIDDLGADDEEIGDDDEGPETLGANASRIADRVDRLEEKRRELKAKLAATPSFKRRRRARIQRHIGRIEARIARKKGRIRAKQEKARARYGSAVPMGRQGGVASEAAGFGRLARSNSVGVYAGSAPSGQELYIPVKFLGANYLEIAFAAAAVAGSSGAISGETDEINYADLLVTGLQVSIQTVIDRPQSDVASTPANNVLVVSEVNSLVTDGNINLFYDDQVMPGSGIEVSSNSGDFWKQNTYRLTGLRDNSILAKNGTCRLIGAVTNVMVPENAFSVVVSAALICQRLRDVVVDKRA